MKRTMIRHDKKMSTNLRKNAWSHVFGRPSTWTIYVNTSTTISRSDPSRSTTWNSVENRRPMGCTSYLHLGRVHTSLSLWPDQGHIGSVIKIALTSLIPSTSNILGVSILETFYKRYVPFYVYMHFNNNFLHDVFSICCFLRNFPPIIFCFSPC